MTALNPKLSIIGSTTQVSFPDQGIENVPAKVDTGADSSSIWASNIEQKGKKLYFTLFEQQSPFYTGEIITCDSFTMKPVKNSFGHTEIRYKVPLKLRVQNKTIKANFTLANRGANRYPILIGRRTLSNHFIVDVSRGKAKKAAKVLILAEKKLPALSRFADRLKDHSEGNVLVAVATYDEVVCRIKRGVKFVLTPGGNDIASFDFIYFKDIECNVSLAAAIVRYATYRGVGFVDSAAARYPIMDKLHQYVTLKDAGLNVPSTFYASREVLKKSYGEIVKVCGKPFVLKDTTGQKANSNYLVADKQEFLRICDSRATKGVSLVAQQYIDNEGEYKVFVLGRNIGLVAWRRGTDGQYLHSANQKVITAKVEVDVLPTAVQADCIYAADLMQLQIASVDVLRDIKSGSWYCLEVNHSPQIASGRLVEEKAEALAEFLQDIESF